MFNKLKSHKGGVIMGQLNKNDKCFIFGLICLAVGMAVP